MGSMFKGIFKRDNKEKVLVLNGPNINLLGIRETTLYGNESYGSLMRLIQQTATRLKISVECKQSNHEGVLVDLIQEAYQKFDGIIINPAAYTHTSVAILDALKAVSIPTIEVHITAIEEREEFRRHSYISAIALATITGKGFAGYVEALQLLCEKLRAENSAPACRR